MATATARKQQPTRPMSYYWNVVKDMDDSQKIELIAILAESIRPTAAKGMETDSDDEPLPRYTLKEMNALLDEAEANFTAGKGIPDDEAWDDLDEELAHLGGEEMAMAETI